MAGSYARSEDDVTGRLFGVEYEWVAGAGAALIELHRNGLAGDDSPHEYHCGCETCDVYPNGDGPPRRRYGWTFHGQKDCTCSGEIITCPLPYGTDEATAALLAMERAAIDGRAVPGQEAGQHVHVDARDLTGADKVRLYRLFLRYHDDLDIFARGRERSVRGYNARMRLNREAWDEEVYDIDTGRFRTTGRHLNFWTSPAEDIGDNYTMRPTGYWLSDHGETMEFRLWNSTRAYWRTRGQVGVSVAMVEAAKAGVNVTARTRRPLEQVLDRWLDEDTWAFIIRQRYAKGGIVAA